MLGPDRIIALFKLIKVCTKLPTCACSQICSRKHDFRSLFILAFENYTEKMFDGLATKEKKEQMCEETRRVYNLFMDILGLLHNRFPTTVCSV